MHILSSGLGLKRGMREHRCGWWEWLRCAPIPGSAILPTLSSTSAAVPTGVESITRRCSRTRQGTRQWASGSRLGFEVWYEPLRQNPSAFPLPALPAPASSHQPHFGRKCEPLSTPSVTTTNAGHVAPGTTEAGAFLSFLGLISQRTRLTI